MMTNKTDIFVFVFFLKQNITEIFKFVKYLCILKLFFRVKNEDFIQKRERRGR